MRRFNSARCRSLLRGFIRSAGLTAAFFVGILLTHIAAALAYLWAGPVLALAVYLLVISGSMQWIMRDD